MEVSGAREAGLGGQGHCSAEDVVCGGSEEGSGG